MCNYLSVISKHFFQLVTVSPKAYSLLGIGLGLVGVWNISLIVIALCKYKFSAYSVIGSLDLLMLFLAPLLAVASAVGMMFVGNKCVFSLILALITSHLTSLYPVINYGANMALIQFLVLFSICQKDQVTSPKSFPVNNIGYMLMIQVCAIYFYSGLHKALSLPWQEGTALQKILLNPAISKLSLQPTLITSNALFLASKLVVLLELFIPFFVFLKATRKLIVLILIFFHIGIFFSLDVTLFSPVMLAVLIPSLICLLGSDSKN